MKLFVAFVLVLLASPAYAGVVSPANNQVIDSDFYVTVTQTNATSVEGKIVGYPWQALEQIGSDTYTKKFLISDYSAGDYVLSVKYTDENMNVVFFTPVNIKIVKSTPTATPTAIPLNNMTIVGFAAGNYTNQTKMWVSVMDSRNASAVAATITAYNPGIVASWTTQNGLTKLDLNVLTPDSYLFKITASNYNDLAFFVNITPPPLPKIVVDGFRDAIEKGSIMTLLFTPADVNVSLLYTNGTYIKPVYHNSTEYKLNTANLEEGSYKLRAEKDGSDGWTKTFFVADMGAHPVVTPAPTPTATPCFNIQETGRCVSAAERDAFYVGMSLRSTPTPTPVPTAVPTTILPLNQQDSSDPLKWIGLIVIICACVYVYKKERGQKTPVADKISVPAKAGSFEERLSQTFTPPTTESIQGFKTTLKCPHCEFSAEVVLPLGTVITSEIVQTYLAKHIKDEHTEKE